MNEPTDWMSAILILGAGLIVGALVLYFYSRRKSRQFGDDPQLALKDLEGKRDALIQQIRELDSDTKLTPEQTSEARRELEKQTADVLRRIDIARGRQVATRPDAKASAASIDVEEVESAPAMNPALKGFLWGAVSFAVLAGLGWFVMQSANPRDEGGSITGGMAAQQQQQQQQPAAPADPMVKALEQAVEKDPTNLTFRNDLAQAYLERDYMMGVFEQTKVVLEKEPENSRALAYQGLVRLAMGEQEEATAMLKRSTKSDPKNLDGWVALAWVYAQADKMAEAEKMIAEAAKQSPNDKQQLEAVFAQMKTQVALAKSQPAQAPVAGGELPPGHPPVDGSTPPAMAAAVPQGNMQRPAVAPDGKSIRVTLNLAPGAKSSSGVLFVMARQPGGGGPPVAVKRMMVTAFPITLDFGSADSMMGQPLPDKFRLEARLDTDGDAATKPPTDPSVAQEGVAPGAVLNLALK